MSDEFDYPNQRDALFHDDPTVTITTECTDPQCEVEHFVIRVIGEHCAEQFECEHMCTLVVFHELTPVDHPLPVCPGGCEETRTWLPRRWRGSREIEPCNEITVRRVG